MQAGSACIQKLPGPCIFQGVYWLYSEHDRKKDIGNLNIQAEWPRLFCCPWDNRFLYYLSAENLKNYAREIKIKSPVKFDECLDNEKYRGLVDQDMKDGANLGITGTPGFFVGLFNPKSGEIQGEVLSGAQPYDAFQKTLEKYLSQN